MSTIQINVPNWLDKICAWPVMVYRKHKYGYTFRRIYLDEGQWTIVDSGDYYALKRFKWIIHGTGNNIYAVRNKIIGPNKTKMVYMQREIMNPPAGIVIDHRNCESLDNRRSNLRPATRAENALNRRKKKNGTAQYRGVWLVKKCGKWAGQVEYKGKRIWLGYFDSEIEAAKAYDEAAKKLHGEFARLNFPEPQITQK